MTEIIARFSKFPLRIRPLRARPDRGQGARLSSERNRSLMLTRIKNRRTAVLPGWALDPGAIYRYQCDAAFPLTDHADYPDCFVTSNWCSQSAF